MVDRSGRTDGHPGDDAGAQDRDSTATLLLDVHSRGATQIVRPVGELSPATYERLRDGLLRCAADEPAAIVVDLAHMRVAIASLLTVFPTVRDRISNWPGVPLVLAAARQSLRTLLDFSAVPRFVPTYRSVNEALEGVNAAPGRRRLQVELPCDPVSARLARRQVEQACREWGIPGIATDAVVVASELVDNMVAHARSEGWLRVELRGNALTIAVADADQRPPTLRVPGLRVVGGRGLVLVDKLSRTWGSAARRPAGKVVWAVLTVANRMRAQARPGLARPTATPPPVVRPGTRHAEPDPGDCSLAVSM